jgi:hypothetical protein
MTQENVIQLPSPQAPEPLSADEIQQVENVLTTMVADARPIESLSRRPDIWTMLVRMCETDPGMLARLELKMRDDMRIAHVDAKDVDKFNFKPIKDEAKQKARTRAAEAAELRQNLRARRKRNASITEAGTADTEILAFAEGSENLDTMSSSTVLQARGWLETHYKGRIWRDTFYGKTMTDWTGAHPQESKIEATPIDDDFLRSVWATVMRENDPKLSKMGKPQMAEAIEMVAKMDERNEPVDWLKSLTWDGTPRLEGWLSRVFYTPDDAYHRAVGRCWLVSMVARVNEPGCQADVAPVLWGPEGTYKSTSIKIVGGKWFGVITTSVDKDKEFLQQIKGKWLVELAELEPLMHRHSTAGKVKNAITVRVDEYRIAYATYPIQVPRTCVMAGSTNNMAWHREGEGGRRFWPISVPRKADTQWLIDNRDQLFAEAFHLYKAGGSWSDVPEDDQKAAIAAHYAEGDPWSYDIERWLETPGLYTGPGCGVALTHGNHDDQEEWSHYGTAVTIGRVLGIVFGRSKGDRNKRDANRVADTMRGAGWKTALVRVGSSRTSPKTTIWVKDDTKAQGELQLIDKPELS